MGAPRAIGRPVARSNLGVKQLVTLLGEWESAYAAYAALAARIRLLIDDGRIATYTRLPAERILADALGRSRTTVVSAYGALREAGYLVSVRGSGSVAMLPRRGPGAVAEIDFAHAVPEPVPGLEAIIERVTGNVPDLLRRPGLDLVGDPLLRRRIADRYTDRGLPTTPAQIVVTLGGQHAIALVARTLLRRADRVVVETPTYPHAYEAIAEAGGRLVSTPVTAAGWDMDHFLEILNRMRPEMAYCIPDFQNPTGASMPSAHRERLADAARRAGTALLVDETTAELDIDRRTDHFPFAAHAPVRSSVPVVTIGSLGKTVWSGLRVGWIRADEDIVDRIVRRRPAGDLGSPIIDQQIAAEVLAGYDDLLAVRSAQLRIGRDTLTGLLRNHLPEWEIPDVNGGLAMWVGLGAPLSSALAAAALNRGVRISAGPKFGVDGAHERYIRVPFTEDADDLAAGVDVLRDVWASLDRPGAPDALTRPA
ncbi:PLP-dependent aminotransferase family protein [Gordonia sp. WA4-43]|uniref:MocR-like transcription factor YczR n=1 Tax=Gordonia sp. WA4-43 TaxID=2878678 RepID=UPI001CFA3A44|nr:PLP-dependent aminotransferase family protein [Gordonia sp. WA4-43]UCZ91746.1 PLP-dependent aminotransferase family protein [Gordonia sp. WA4-43]